MEWLSDGAWHGYYGSTHILAVRNRNNTATPVVSSERYYAGYTDAYGMYQPGDDDHFETAWLGLKRMDVFGNWAKFSQIIPAYYPSIGWTLLWTDSEFDAFTGFSYDSNNDGYDWTPRVSFYKARNKGGGGWVKHAGVAYSERWWNGWNKDFQYCRDNDCANFVSQCLNAGMGYSGGTLVFLRIADGIRIVQVAVKIRRFLGLTPMNSITIWPPLPDFIFTP